MFPLATGLCSMRCFRQDEFSAEIAIKSWARVSGTHGSNQRFCTDWIIHIVMWEFNIIPNTLTQLAFNANFSI